MDNSLDNLAHEWAYQQKDMKPSRKVSGGLIFYEGNTFYAVSKDYPIAQIFTKPGRQKLHLSKGRVQQINIKIPEGYKYVVLLQDQGPSIVMNAISKIRRALASEHYKVKINFNLFMKYEAGDVETNLDASFTQILYRRFLEENHLVKFNRNYSYNYYNGELNESELCKVGLLSEKQRDRLQARFEAFQKKAQELDHKEREPLDLVYNLSSELSDKLEDKLGDRRIKRQNSAYVHFITLKGAIRAKYATDEKWKERVKEALKPYFEALRCSTLPIEDSAFRNIQYGGIDLIDPAEERSYGRAARAASHKDGSIHPWTEQKALTKDLLLLAVPDFKEQVIAILDNYHFYGQSVAGRASKEELLRQWKAGEIPHLPSSSRWDRPWNAYMRIISNISQDISREIENYLEEKYRQDTPNFSGDDAYLKVLEDKIITSHHATLPLRVAKIAWLRLKKGKLDRGQHIGPFTYYGIDDDGRIVHIGCHRILMSEIDWLAQTQGWDAKEEITEEPADV